MFDIYVGRYAPIRLMRAQRGDALKLADQQAIAGETLVVVTMSDGTEIYRVDVKPTSDAADVERWRRS